MRRDIVGTRMGRLVVVKQLPRKQNYGRDVRHYPLLCRCDCGAEKIVLRSNLKRTLSCGCWRAEARYRHGRHATAEYKAWQNMLSRCRNDGAYCARNHGSRGIAVCKRWHEFENFLVDMGARPSPQHSIDRINNDGNYEPNNCRWATTKQQGHNKRSNRVLTVGGVSRTTVEWAALIGISENTLRGRLLAGWSDEEAIKTPLVYVRASREMETA